MTLLRTTASLLALAAGVPAALAQQANDVADIVVTAQRENRTEVSGDGQFGVLGDRDGLDTPFQLRAYNEQLILNQQPLTLGDVVDNDPTVRTTLGFGNAAEQFVIRGFALFGDDVGLNGLYGIAPRQLVAPELYQSVQVLNGASAFLNGAAPGGSGLGGSVNLVLKRAGESPLTRATLGYVGDAHFGGSFDVSRRIGGDGAVGVRLNGAFRSGDVAIDGEFRRTLALGGAFDWRGEGVRLSLDVGYQRVEVDGLRHKVTIRSATLPDPVGSDASYAQPWTYTDLRDVFGVARIEVDLGDDALFYATAGARDGREDGIYGGINLLDAETGAANGTALFVPRTDNNEAAEAGVRVKLGQAITHRIVAGANISHQVNRNAFDFLYGPGFAGFATNIYDAPEVPIPASTLVGGDLDDPYPVSRIRYWSAFASDTIGLLDDRLQVTGGLRLQSLRTRTYGNYDGGLPGPVSDDSAVTPVLGIVARPTEWLSLFANRIEGLQEGPEAPFDAPVELQGIRLSPVRTLQYEVGGKARLGGMELGVSLFDIERPSAFVDRAAGTFDYNGNQRNRGAEFTLSGDLTPTLRFIGGFSILDAELRETEDANEDGAGDFDGNRAPGVPDLLVNANLEWDTPFVPGLTLTGRVVHTGDQSVDQTNRLELGSWTRVDVGARYVLAAGGRPVTLRVGVDNLFDEAYWASAFDGFEPALFPGDPRTARASLSVDF